MYILLNFVNMKAASRMDAEFYKSYRKTEINFVRLKDLCKFIDSGPAGSVLDALSYKAAGVKVIRPSNIDGWNCENGQFVFIDRAKIAKRKIRIYIKGDLLVGRIGDFKCGIVEREKCVISSNLLALRVNKKLCNPYFLLAYLNSDSAYEQIKSIAKKVSLSSINTNSFSNFEIPLLPLKTQKIIAKQVKEAFKLIQESKVAFLCADQILRKKIFFNEERDILTRNFFRLSQLNENKRMDAEFYCNNIRSKIKNVTYRKLGEIGYIQNGIEPGRKMYSKNGALFLRPSNIGKLGFINKSQKYISMKYYKKISDKYQPGIGEVLLVKDGKIGFACVVVKLSKSIISSGIVRIKVGKEFDAAYIALCLNSEICTGEMMQNIEGSLVPHLNIQAIRNLAIPIVDLETQKTIVRLMSASYLKYNQATELLKKAVKATSQTKYLVN